MREHTTASMKSLVGLLFAVLSQALRYSYGDPRIEFKVQYVADGNAIRREIWHSGDVNRTIRCQSDQPIRFLVQYFDWKGIPFCDSLGKSSAVVVCQIQKDERRQKMDLNFFKINDDATGNYTCLEKKIGFSGGRVINAVSVTKVKKISHYPPETTESPSFSQFSRNHQYFDPDLLRLEANHDIAHSEICSVNHATDNIQVQWISDHGKAVRRKKRANLSKLPFQIYLSKSVSVLFVKSEKASHQQTFTCYAKSSKGGRRSLKTYQRHRKIY